MIEAATGVAFLVASIYGAGQANAQTAAASTAAQATPIQAVTTHTDYSSSEAVEKYVKERFAGSKDRILVDIARCESTFRQFGSDGEVIRGKVNKYDVGVMQINELYHGAEAAKLGYDIYSLQGNVAFGKYLYDKYGTSPWISSSKCWSDSDTIAQR